MKFLAILNALAMMFNFSLANFNNAVGSFVVAKETVTDTVQVLEVYQDFRTKGYFLWREQYSEKDSLGYKYEPFGSYFANLGHIWSTYLNEEEIRVYGIPGWPALLEPKDIVSAKAVYSGQHITITLELQEQIDEEDGSSNTQAVSYAIGALPDAYIYEAIAKAEKQGCTVDKYTVAYLEPSIMIELFTTPSGSTGIGEACYGYHAVTNVYCDGNTDPLQFNTYYVLRKS